MHDYYRILGVARGASPQIAKIAFEGKMKALADPAYAASPAEKREEERLLREAVVTLTVPAKRGPYDGKLAAFEAANAEAPSRPAWLVPAALAAVVALAAGGLWVNNAREKERLRLEEERLAMEKETARRQADAEEARIREMQARREESAALVRERNEQARIQRERADYERWRRTQEAQARYNETAQERAARNAVYEKQREEE